MKWKKIKSKHKHIYKNKEFHNNLYVNWELTFFVMVDGASFLIQRKFKIPLFEELNVFACV